MTDASTINSLGGYPLGAADDPRAPYNQKEPKDIEVEVTVSVTYSKTFKIVVPENYERPDLIDAVKNGGYLPNSILEEKTEALKEELETNNWLFTGEPLESIKRDIEKCSPWHEDELEVIANDEETHFLFQVLQHK